MSVVGDRKTAVRTAVHVLVLGPPDLITTSVAAALQAHGFAAAAQRGGDPLPPPHSEGGVIVLNLDVPDSTRQIATAAAAGWQPVAVFRPSDPPRAAAAVAAGALALVSRTATIADLVDVLTTVAAGEPAMSREERATWHDIHAAALLELDGRRRRLDTLTEREFEVLRRLERGQRAADIATDVVVAISTVRTHIRSILVKLEVNSQQQAIALYRETRRRGV